MRDGFAAGDDIPSLPEDAAALRALVLATTAERDAAVSERDTLLAQNDRLRHLLLKLTRMQFGAKSERLPEEQMQLGLEALEQAIAKAGAEAEKRGPELRKNNARRRASRGALPAHLPRIEVTLVPDDTGCPCRRTPVTVIGEDSSERLNVIPAPYRVIVTKRAGVQSKPQLAAKRAGSGLLQNLLHEHSIGAADHLKRRSAWLWPQLPRAAANVSAFTGAPSHGVASHC